MHTETSNKKKRRGNLLGKPSYGCILFLLLASAAVAEHHVPPLHLAHLLAKASAPIWIGNGLFVNEQGFLITPYHCVVGIDPIFVVVYFSNDTFKAEVVDSLPEADLALLKVHLPHGNIPNFTRLCLLDPELRFPFIVEVGFVISCPSESTGCLIVRGVVSWITRDTLYVCSKYRLTSGLSGSPVLLCVMGRPTNVIVGLLQSGQRWAIYWERSRRLVIAKSTFGVIPNHFIAKFLKRNHIRFLVKRVTDLKHVCSMCHELPKEMNSQ